MARILVIDDTMVVLHEVARMLRAAGHEVHGFNNGRPALELLARERFDLVLTDVYMPGMDGFEILQTLRRQYRSLPVIAMSADPRPFDALATARILGAVQTLWKPFGAGELLAAVDAAMPARAG